MKSGPMMVSTHRPFEDLAPGTLNGSQVGLNLKEPIVVDDRLYFRGTDTGSFSDMGLWYIEAC